MTDLTDSDVRYSELTKGSADPRYFLVVLGWIVVINLLTFIYHVSNATIFNTLSNTASIALIGYAACIVLRSSKNSSANVIFLAAACGLTLLSIGFNISNASTTDAIKYLSIYVFYAAGYASDSQPSRVETRIVCFLAALPLVFLVVFGDSRVPEFVLYNLAITFSYFANANVATLYFGALIFTLTHRLGAGAIGLQFANALLMNKIGPAVATVVATGLWILFPLRKQSVIGLAAAALVAMIALAAGALDRIIAVLETMRVLVDLGPEYISRMSFKRLVEITGTTDLSGFFRVIHWANIWDVYSGSGFGTLLFGYGIGQTPNLAVLPFVPHNDYLRILVEYGPLNLIVFICFLVHVLLNLRTGPPKVLFMVLLIYFFSENLLDHFASMTLYFTYAGRFAAKSREEKPLHMHA